MKVKELRTLSLISSPKNNKILSASNKLKSFKLLYKSSKI